MMRAMYGVTASTSVDDRQDELLRGAATARRPAAISDTAGSTVEDGRPEQDDERDPDDELGQRGQREQHDRGHVVERAVAPARARPRRARSTAGC